MYADNLSDLIAWMEATEQTHGLSVLEHGHMVHESYLQLVDELDQGVGPSVLQNLWESLRERLVALKDIEEYQVYHDCGKPVCAAGGHFPGHAEHSANQWAKLFGQGTVSELMRLDMKFHLMNAEEAATFWSHPLAPTLYVTAWAEIRANAGMFGGEDSTSFKIKKKKLERAGRALKSPVLEEIQHGRERNIR